MPDKRAYLNVSSIVTEGSTENSRSRTSVKRNILILKAKNISGHVFFVSPKEGHVFQEWSARTTQRYEIQILVGRPICRSNWVLHYRRGKGERKV